MNKDENTVEIRFTCTEDELKMIKHNARNCSLPIERYIKAAIYYFDNVLKRNLELIQ